MLVPLLLARESAKGGCTGSKWIGVAIAGRIGGKTSLCLYILLSSPLVS